MDIGEIASVSGKSVCRGRGHFTGTLSGARCETAGKHIQVATSFFQMT